MSLILYGHEFSSYTWKALIPLWANDTPFEFRSVERHGPEFAALAPFGQFPLLVDDGRVIAESSIIIEHLDRHHPGPNRWIPEGDEGLRVRFLDRVFDQRIMDTAQPAVANALRPPEHKDPYGLEQAMQRLRRNYDWLEGQLAGDGWAAGETFTMADCAAAPALFYADWVDPIGPNRPKLAAYRARLLAHPAVSRAVEQARPFRHYFPLGAPDRD
ncbi:glutathione S-transferase family protein [Sphingomonas astaxanthinifaciens]|uniref:Glutathione S-transferase n=1 Tax=Sphingomonas astaxanthinifaciens DSM 22298 TaxID=1123267 RepID=A0ABQ5Z376_9SPHN|nr:glutathione S-transferase family protein [Sphingomonas astaxanthinifaciens]GLR46476.1 glutathione S-transferase [Sphingomonas astaxanthinifaciens DSM 22298]